MDNKSPDFLNPDYKQPVNESHRDISVIEQEITDSFEALEEEIIWLEMDAEYLSHMQSNNEDIEFESKKYSDEEVRKVEKRIEKSKQIIHQIEKDISDLKSLKVPLQSIIDQFSSLDQKFKKILITIEPFRNQ